MAISPINEIKVIIRGLLTSSPEEVTVRQLRRDFLKQEGRDIPFYEFGFHDITSFLRSMPDLCKIVNGNGPYATVHLIESKKSSHVSSLVLRQRPSVRGPRRKRDIPVRPANRFVKKCVKDNHENLVDLKSNDAHGKVTLLPPSCDHKFNNMNKSSLFGEKTSVSKDVNQLTEIQSYKPIFNDYTSTSQGCWSTAKCESRNLTRKTEFPDIDSLIVSYLHQLLIDQKAVHITEVEEHLQDYLSVYDLACPDNVQDILKKVPDIIVEDGFIHQRLEQSKKNTSVTSLISLNAVEADAFVPVSNSEDIQRIEEKLFNLMKDYKEGFLGSELKEKYQKKYSAALNLKALGYETPWHLIVNKPHIFNFIPLKNGDFKLLPAPIAAAHLNEQPAKKELNNHDSKIKTNIPEITKRNIQWLMQGYPNGLKSKHFEQTYKDAFLGGIELKQMGFSCVEELLSCLEELSILQIRIVGSDVWLLPSNELGNLTISSDPLPPEEYMKLTNEDLSIQRNFPNDVVGPDKHIEQVEIPSWIEEASLIEIFVQEIHNPHNFWVTFCGEHYTRALDSLMDDIQAFYCSKSHSYKMPMDLIKEGQDCITQYIEEWHRARITCIVSPSEVEVLFYDYGTKQVVKKDSIHFLHIAYSTLPAQAIRAVLANIAPVGGKWSQGASKRFLQLIADKALIGVVKGVDRLNKIINLYLCDTTGVDDIYIHEILISEHFAIRCSEKNGDFLENDRENNLKREGIVNQETFTAPEEEICGRINNFDQETDEDRKRITSSDSSVHEERISETILDSLTQNPSRKSSMSSLPCGLLNDQMDCLQSISDSASCITSPSHPTKQESNTPTPNIDSTSVLHSNTPPPGFNFIPQRNFVPNMIETKEVGENHDDQCHKNCEQIGKEQDITNQSTKIGSIKIPVDSRPIDCLNTMKMDCGLKDLSDSKRCVSSGVNANFSSDVKKPPVNPNLYSFPNWPMIPPACTVLPNFPSVSPFNANAVTAYSLGSYSFPSAPNPFDFCSLWYYEQIRQQAFIQGLLAQQQIAASGFPSASPGIFVPSSVENKQPTNQNLTNIAELNSPDKTPSLTSNFKKTSENGFPKNISEATQTEMTIWDMDSEEGLQITSNKYKKALDQKTSQTERILCEEEKGCSSSCGNKLSGNVNENTSFNSDLETNFHQSRKSNATEVKACVHGVNSDGSGIMKQTLQEFKVLSLGPLTDNICNRNDSNAFKYENCNENNSHVPSKLPNGRTDEENLQECTLQDKWCRKSVNDANKDICFKRKGIKIRCNAKSGDNGFTHKIGNNGIQNSYENSAMHSDVITAKVNFTEGCTISNKRSGESLLEEQEEELAELIYTNTFCCNQINCNEDFHHEHEMIGKAQEEFLNGSEAAGEDNSFNCQIQERHSIDVKKMNTTSEPFSLPSNSMLSDNYNYQECVEQTLEGEEHYNLLQTDNTYCSSGKLEDRMPASSLPVNLFDHRKVSKSNTGAFFSQHASSLFKEDKLLQTASPEISNKSRSFPLVTENIEDSEGKAPINLSNIEQPMLESKLSKEVSAVIISGPTQPFMTQKKSSTSLNEETENTKESLVLPQDSTSLESATWKTSQNCDELDRRSQTQAVKESQKSFTMGSALRNLSRQTIPKRARENYSSSKCRMNSQFVKKINLCGKSVNQVNLDGRPYVFTDEIVHYFTPFNGRHIILKILEALKVEINFLELTRKRRPEFFECLDKSDITSISRSQTGNVTDTIHIVPLRSVPYMLRALNKEDTALAADVKEEMEKFDPNDAYWFNSNKFP